MPSFLRLCAVLACTLFSTDAAAQIVQTWTPRDDLNAGLPGSIRVFEAAQTSFSLTAWYVEADLSADDGWRVRALLSDASGGTETTASFAADAEALVAINGGYYSGSQSFSLVAEDGVVSSSNIATLNRGGVPFFPTRGAFAVLEDGTPDVAWISTVDGVPYAYPTPSPNAPGVPQPQSSSTFPEGGAPWPLGTGIGGGPVLVDDGALRLTWEEEVFFGGSGVDLGVRRARTVLGYTADNRLLILVAAERSTGNGLTLTEAAEVMLDLGAVEAVNLDGGGSTSLVVGDTDLTNTTRRVASAFLLAPPPDDEPDGALYFDTGDACCYRETDGWFESANPPFYGGTPSRLNEVGDGSDTATFVFEGIGDATYELAAWWVPSTNRAGDTPYTVYQQGIPTTVRVDQRPASTSNRWNVLGRFILLPGDSVVVSDGASGGPGRFVTVDALRLSDPSAVPNTDDDRPGATAFEVFPNPAADRLTLAFETPLTRPASVSVLDVLGRVVAQTEITGARSTIALPDLAPGRYVLRVALSEGRAEPLTHRPLTIVR
ncbi:MAG: phosphodiester glycosidase family protein [Bacteroidota bacterium]